MLACKTLLFFARWSSVILPLIEKCSQGGERLLCVGKSVFVREGSLSASTLV